MARPRAFDTEKALDGAMAVFWKQGFDSASLTDLLNGMGLTRGSLYKAFTDKKSLFLTVLTRYEDAAVTPAVELLNSPDIEDGLDRITTLFELLLKTVRDGDRRGCMLCSAAAGPASDDDDIAKEIQKQLGKMEAGFLAALGQSSVHKDLPLARRQKLAALLLSQYVGTRVLARADASLSVLEGSVPALNALLSYTR